MDIAKIYWNDSRMYITQCDKDEKFEVCSVESVGFLLKETKREIVLVGDLIDGEYRRVLVIPVENIQNKYINGKLIK